MLYTIGAFLLQAYMAWFKFHAFIQTGNNQTSLISTGMIIIYTYGKRGMYYG